jgi:hypothetical protein
MFGKYVGKYGLNTSTPSPGFRKVSQKNCSKTFAPGPATMLAASAGMSNSLRLVVLDRLQAARTCRRSAVERAIADLELDDVLALGFELFRQAEHRERGFYGKGAGEITQLRGHEKPSSVRVE